MDEENKGWSMTGRGYYSTEKRYEGSQLFGQWVDSRSEDISSDWGSLSSWETWPLCPTRKMFLLIPSEEFLSTVRVDKDLYGNVSLKDSCSNCRKNTSRGQLLWN